MIRDQKIVVVLPAYNAARTLERTYREIPHEYVDEVLLVDDCSQDETLAEAERLGITAIQHHQNLGYGGNQKTCYREALARGADIVVMLHPDYQYSPRLVIPMAAMVESGHYDMVLASRILVGSALEGGMPLYKYLSNRVLTLAENVLLGRKLSEYHTGYRAFSRRVLEKLPLSANSDNFVFDNQMIAQAVHFGFQIGEISCPARYNEDASSIDFWSSTVYGFGVLGTALRYRLQRWGLKQFPIFTDDGSQRLTTDLIATEDEHDDVPQSDLASSSTD